jgi:hypothetical protein
MDFTLQATLFGRLQETFGRNDQNLEVHSPLDIGGAVRFPRFHQGDTGLNKVDRSPPIAAKDPATDLGNGTDLIPLVEHLPCV